MSIETLQQEIRNFRATHGASRNVDIVQLSFTFREYETIVDTIIDLKKRIEQLEREAEDNAKT